MILEGIVTTQNADGTTNISPMGPRVTDDFNTFELRPFATSMTYQNLRQTGQGVLHVTDDVELIALAVTGRLSPLPPLTSIRGFQVPRLADTCRWFAFRVNLWDDSDTRATIQCQTVLRGRVRDFFGFNRAKHAVLEVAILASRIGLLPPEQIRDEMARLAIVVEKTAGQSERRAWKALVDYCQEHGAAPAKAGN